MENIKELKAITSSYKLLYAEDDKDIAQAFITYLSKLFDEVVYVENGEQGLEFYKQQDFDLVITDIKMPKMNGLEMSQEIKKINKEQNIVVVSAYSSADIFLSSIKIGIDGYLVKPINYADMNNVLFKLCTKIKKFRENDEHQKTLEKYVSQITQKNTELTQYLDILNNVAIISKTDLTGKITYVNDFFCEVSEYSKEEILGQSHNIIRHQDMAKSVYEDMWETIQAGRVWKGTIKNKTKSGNSYFVVSTIIPLFDENHKIKEYFGVRFLTTKEEEEKREFKRKVMMSYQEFRKETFNATKKIQLLNDEIKMLSTDNKRLTILATDLKEKNQKFITQMNFYEKEIKAKEENYHRSLESTSSNSKNIIELHKKDQMKIDSQRKEIDFLKEDYNLKVDQVNKLEDKLKEQREIIQELRTLSIKKNPTEEEEEKEGKLNKLFNKFL